MQHSLKKIHTFVITMPNEINRQKKAKYQLKDISDNFEFFFAPGKPEKIPSNYNKWKRRFYFGRDLTLGEFGCFQSHKSVLKKIVIYCQQLQHGINRLNRQLETKDSKKDN